MKAKFISLTVMFLLTILILSGKEIVAEESANNIYLPLIVNQPQCNTTRIISPKNRLPVSNPVEISWEPASCPMVIQIYQNGRLMHEGGKEEGVYSPYVIEIAPGPSEIKIWSLFSPEPADSVSVTVVPTSTLTPTLSETTDYDSYT